VDVDPGFLKTQWDAFSNAPVPAMLFLALGAMGAWWLKSTVAKGQIEALKEKRAVAEERARLAADKVQPAVEKVPETDEKGNVKPPAKPSTPETPADDQNSDHDEISWLIGLQYAYLEEGDCLSKITAYYNKLKYSTHGLAHAQQVEAEYLLARFRCGISSALDTLKDQSGPTTDAFFANAVLSEYYTSVGESATALTYLQYRFDHAPDSRRKFYSALSLGKCFADIGKSEEGISFLKGQMSYFQTPNDHAELWEAIGAICEMQGLHWRQQLCFEKSLALNPDNTELRFSLAYSYGHTSYGKAMAAYHYEMLLKQTPRNSTAANNLSVIYDEMGAVTTKISLLREAQRRKDSAYVSANLATAYAKAGFIRDARDYLEQVPVGSTTTPSGFIATPLPARNSFPQADTPFWLTSSMTAAAWAKAAPLH
jgi:tetratricopeptide (TPR) repeat protein